MEVGGGLGRLDLFIGKSASARAVKAWLVMRRRRGQGCWANNTGLVTRAGDEDVELTDIEIRTSVESR